MGSLVSKVIYIKENDKKDFIILDVAMNDFMRPALYGANHTTLPVIKTNQTSKKIYEFVGPICESTDKFATLKKFQRLKEKDLVVMCDVGAYGMSLSSNYNVRPKPKEVLIRGSKISVIKKRQKLEEHDLALSIKMIRNFLFSLFFFTGIIFISLIFPSNIFFTQEVSFIWWKTYGLLDFFLFANFFIN